jgi:hypothetical protein
MENYAKLKQKEEKSFHTLIFLCVCTDIYSLKTNKQKFNILITHSFFFLKYITNLKSISMFTIYI